MLVKRLLTLSLVMRAAMATQKIQERPAELMCGRLCAGQAEVRQILTTGTLEVQKDGASGSAATGVSLKAMP